jgi:hypothetical protein
MEATTSFSYPRVVEIRKDKSEPNLEIVIDNDWVLFLGGSTGRRENRNYINIRKKYGIKGGHGVSIPVDQLDCILEALKVLKNTLSQQL